ncbi:hypothetical protein LCGC14_1722050 [marine sediment metagenome]|uniref:Uncharacterized protein n=1 Tax=marine sediment metagenome TaxID=412755 RepID=A0A0F9HBX8_9ZZZZ
MGAFRTDPSITARGIAPPFDPIAAMSRIANLRRLQQRGQINQQTLEDMERERARKQGIGQALGGGGTRADVLRRLQEGRLPIAAEKYEAESRKIERQAAGEERAEAGEERAARKSQLENAKSTYGLIGQLAGPLNALEEQGADIETMQVAYADSLGKLADAGIDTSKLPQEYKSGMAQQAMMEAVSVSKQIDQALRADELEERKRVKPTTKQRDFASFYKMYREANNLPDNPNVKMAAWNAWKKGGPTDPGGRGKALALRTMQKAEQRATHTYRIAKAKLEEEWTREGDQYFNRESGEPITNGDFQRLLLELKQNLDADVEDAREAYSAQVEALGYEPTEAAFKEKENKDPLGLFP